MTVDKQDDDAPMRVASLVSQRADVEQHLQDLLREHREVLGIEPRKLVTR